MMPPCAVKTYDYTAWLSARAYRRVGEVEITRILHSMCAQERARVEEERLRQEASMICNIMILQDPA